MTPKVIESKATYENFKGKCPFCNKENIFNRCDDLKTFQRISGMDVECQFCDNTFRLLGDSIVNPYKEIFWQAESYLPKKEYMLSVILLAQSIEMFFYHAIHESLFYDFKKDIDTKTYNELNEKCRKKFKRKVFEDLRKIFLDIYIADKKFKTVVQTEEYLNNLHMNLRKKIIKSPKDTEVPKLLLVVKTTEINSVRNKIVYKFGYRPSLPEVEPLFKDGAEIVFELALELNFSYQEYLSK